jgi:hypothetical protein
MTYLWVFVYMATQALLQFVVCLRLPFVLALMFRLGTYEERLQVAIPSF